MGHVNEQIQIILASCASAFQFETQRHHRFVLWAMEAEERCSSHSPSTYAVDRSRRSVRTHPQGQFGTSYRSLPLPNRWIPPEFLSQGYFRVHSVVDISRSITRERQCRIKVPYLVVVMENYMIVPYYRHLRPSLEGLGP